MSKITRKLETRLKRFQSNPLVKSYSPRLSQVDLPAPVWNNIFYRLHEALKYYEEQNQESRNYYVFSLEKKRENQFTDPSQTKNSSVRQYIVSGLEEFWTYYIQLPSNKRHFYEVIPENSPCHLYFDLEYETAVNLEKSGDLLTEIWIKYVCLQLQRIFEVKCDRSCVIELESSSSNKFSKHLIFRLDSMAFKNVLHTGAFVQSICGDLMKYLTNAGDEGDYINQWKIAHLNDFLVINGKGDPDLFVDQGVYNKNRNFRLFLSSKISKNIELKLSELCSYGLLSHTSPREISNDQLKSLFQASLITNVSPHSKLIEVSSLPDTNYSKSTISVTPSMLKRTSNNPHFCPLSFNLMTQLQEDVLAYLHRFNKSALIRQYSFILDSSTIIFDVIGSRFCGNINREHKSNNIMIVVNLKSQTLHQSCYDPDCRRSEYRSSSAPLSYEVCQLIDFEMDDTDYSDILQVNETFSNDPFCVSENCEISDMDLMNAVIDIEKVSAN